MIKLFLIALLCVAFAQSEPDTDKEQGSWLDLVWNAWKKAIQKHLNDINNLRHRGIEQQHPTVEETSPTGTPDPPGATNLTETTNPIEVSITTGASNPTGESISS